MQIPVYTVLGFSGRFVTHRQHAAEVAGKVLARHGELWRTAEKRYDPVVGEYWLASYFKPTELKVKEWENHRRDNRSTYSVAH